MGSQSFLRWIGAQTATSLVFSAAAYGVVSECASSSAKHELLAQSLVAETYALLSSRRTRELARWCERVGFTHHGVRTLLGVRSSSHEQIVSFETLLLQWYRRAVALIPARSEYYKSMVIDSLVIQHGSLYAAREYALLDEVRRILGSPELATPIFDPETPEFDEELVADI